MLNYHKNRVIITIILIMLLPASIIIFYNYREVTHVDNIIPKIHYWKNKAGVDTFFVAKSNTNTIDVQLTLDAGSARDNGKPGLAYLVNQIIATLAADQNQLVEHWIDKDRAVFKLKLANSLSNKLSNTAKNQVTTLANLVADPFFVVADPDLSILLKKLKTQLLLNLGLKKQDPLHLANIETYKLLYDKHPYANYELGNSNKELDYISIEDLKYFHHHYYVTDNIIITIVGNADRNIAITLSNLIAANLARGARAVPLPDLDQTRLNNPQNKSFNYGSNNQQSTIVMSQIVAPVYDVDYFNLIIGNNILANNAYSRLVQLTRRLLIHQEAQLYDINSNLIMLNKPGPLLLSFYTAKKYEEQAIKEAQEALANFIDYGPTAEEVQLCKQHFINSFPLEFITNEQILDKVSLIGFYKLPIDFFEHYIDNLSVITKESILHAWKKRINLHRMNTVIIRS